MRYRARRAAHSATVLLGYQADGLYIGLGIGDYSDVSGNYARDFANERGLRLIEVSVRGDLLERNRLEARRYKYSPERRYLLSVTRRLDAILHGRRPWTVQAEDPMESM